MTTGATGGVYYIAFSQATAAAHVVKAAVTAKKLRILGAFLSAAGAVNLTFEDEDGTDLMGLITLAAAGDQINMQPSLLGYAETSAGKGLNILLSGAVGVRGVVIVQVVD